MPGWCFPFGVALPVLLGFKSLTQAAAAWCWIGSKNSGREGLREGGWWSMARLARRCSRPLAASAGSCWFPARWSGAVFSAETR
jgi:hypothetical protein